MVKLDTSKGVLFVDFIYDVENGVTTAHLLRKDGEDYLVDGLGVVKLYHKDKYNKVEGRKRALLEAMKNSGFVRSERASLWEQFFKVCKKE